MAKGKNKSATSKIKKMMKDVKDSKPIGKPIGLKKKRKSYNEH